MQTTASFAEMTLNRTAANDLTGRKPDGESEPTWTAFWTTSIGLVRCCQTNLTVLWMFLNFYEWYQKTPLNTSKLHPKSFA